MFEVVSVLGHSFASLASVINIVHVFVCGDDVGPSTTNANELANIRDGAANVNSETQALTAVKLLVHVENIFYLYLKYLLLVILYVYNKHS